MKFRKYTFQCTDMNGVHLFDMPLTFPVYTVDEYNSFISTYNSKYANISDKIVIYGKGNTVGSLTEYGSFLLNTMGLKYCGIPYTLPVNNDFNKWLLYILSNLIGQYDITSNISIVPITGTDSMWTVRKFKMISGNRESVTSFYTYTSTSDKYRAQFLDSEYGFRGSSYGSGTGSNNENDMYGVFILYYLVEDERIGYISLSGYYDKSIDIPESLKSLKGSLGFAESNPPGKKWFNELIKNNKDYEDTDPTDTDPYKRGGDSETGGGTGDFDGTSDSIDIPELPTLSATDAGFITLYNPTRGQLHSLANYLWSDAFDLETFKKLYADPMSVILGLSIVPVSVPNGGARTVTVGNRSTGISMNLAASQYVSIDCGTLNVNEFWGAYLDYAPFTDAEIYLPYIGIHPIATDDIMGKPVHVVYHVDILSGACCAYVKCGSSVLYSFIGQCSSSIPISGNDWTNVINGVISIAGSIGSMVATGGMSAPMEIGNIASNAVNASKPKVEKSGALGGTGGMLNIQKPYLILTRPKQALPSHQNNYTGYPSFITENFSELTGYTEVYKTHLENIPATNAEISEIESLLKSGVIF